MISKRTKIMVSLLSISIFAFLITSALAANYNREQQLWAVDGVPLQFRITVSLDVTTTTGSEGYKISSYDTDKDFWTTWWIFWPNYQFVDVDEDIILTRLWNGDILAVEYEVSGKVWKRTDHSKYVMVEVWVKIWADGGMNSDASYWDDNFGFTYLKSF